MAAKPSLVPEATAVANPALSEHARREMPQVVPTRPSRVVLFADGVRELPDGWEEFIREPLVLDGVCELTYQDWYYHTVQLPRLNAVRGAAINDAIRQHFGLGGLGLR